ncbi:hypothetical protein GCM10023186_24510 [Hymenobacter koreensis]|uniref:Secretion system C-terminal sorting domain-containing protein n=2 Tax=Hymenobacter koreensis TaxID=1084523 RepID=A0ABP8J1T1_9BACT
MPAVPDGGRYGMGYCQDPNALYMIGGGSTVAPYTSEVYRFDLATGSWGSGPLSTGQVTPHRFGTAVIIPPYTSNNLIYVLNAATNAGPLATLPVLQTSNGQASTALANATPSSTAALAVWNGLLYAYGGQLANGTYTNQLRSYNPATNVWTTLAPMPEAKNTFGAAVNGKLYAIGGYNGVVNSDKVHVYDIATNQWQLQATLPTTLSNQAVAVQGEWIWLVGDFNNLNYLAAYNTRTAQLRTFTSNIPGRRNAAAAIHNNQLYVWGGNTASAGSATLSDMWRANVSNVLATSSARASAPLLSAHPNPSTTGDFTLVLPANSRTLEVHDAMGRQVHTSFLAATAKEYQLRLSHLPAGVYSVRVRTSQGLSAPCQLLRR